MAKKNDRSEESVATKGSKKPNRIITRSSESYGLMLAVGLLICAYVTKNLESSFIVDLLDFEIFKFHAILVCLGSGILLVLHAYCQMQFEDQYHQFRAWMSSALGTLSVPGALYLALIAAIGEEVFFRAALQPHLGILFLSSCLALLHYSPNGVLPVFLFLSFATNVLLGLVFKYSGSIYPGFCINFISSAWILIRCAASRAPSVRENCEGTELQDDDRVKK